MTGLQAHVVVRRPAFTLDAQVACRPGRVLAVLGPNGAGKSTLLQVLAGLETPHAGRVVLDGAVLDDPAAGVRLRPEQRGVGLVPQSGLLFPHLSALDNIAFGLRARGASARQARPVARSWLDRFGLAAHADDRPAALSGGQAQRVALARALATGPGLLLLDEPLSALDAGTRALVRGDLAGHLRQVTSAATLLVTHDALDALVLADDLVVLDGGRVVQAGAPADVAAHPATEYVAELVGVTLCRGRGDGTTVHLDGGGSLVVSRPVTGAVAVAVRPSAVALYRRRPEGTVRNAWEVTVTGLQQHASGVRVTLAGPPHVAADVTAAAVAELGLGPGTRMWAGVKASELSAYPVG